MVQEENEKETLNTNIENTESEKKDNDQEIVSETDGQENKSEPEIIDEKEVLKNEVSELKDKHLRLYSEFENFRRRTAKEKIDLVKTGNEDVLASLLPVLDDFERAQKSIQDEKGSELIKEGISLIYQKLYRTLESKGLKPMVTEGEEFNPDLHEAITQAPAPSEKLKGKVLTEVEKGYLLNDKVIRFAKVIVGF